MEDAYSLAAELKSRILLSEDRERTASAFFNEHGLNVKLEDIIVLNDGTPVLKDDPGRDYDREELQEFKNYVSEQLDLFGNIILPGSEDDGRTSQKNKAGTRNSSGTGHSPRRNPILRNGVSAYYSHQKGWNGKEQPPWTVKGAWDSFGFVDFLGLEIRSPKDVAQMFSIYRNPMLEYFHIVLVRDRVVVRQLAMTSGLSGIVRIIPEGGFEKIAEDISATDYDSAYLVHNHPSGNVSPSNQDIYSTEAYIRKVFRGKFGGHIILDHDKFMLLSCKGDTLQDFENLHEEAIEYSPHKIPEVKIEYDTSICSPNDVASFVFSLHGDGNVMLNLTNDHKVRDIAPFSVENYDAVSFMMDMQAKYIRNRIIVVSSEDSFKDLIRKFESYNQKAYQSYRQPVLDVMYIDRDKQTYVSLLERGRLDSFNWQGFLAKQPRANSYIWDEDLLKNPKQGYLFETHQPYVTLKDIFCPTQNETTAYERNLKEHTGKAPIRIVEKSPLLHALGLPDGSISISERALNKAKDDKSVSTLIDKLPEIVLDPSSIIDTGLKARKDSKSNCLLFAYNAYLNEEAATIGMIIEPVQRKLKTDYVIREIYPPEKLSKDKNRLLVELAKNRKFIYSETLLPCFPIPRIQTGTKDSVLTKITLPEKIPDRWEVLDRCWEEKKRDRSSINR